jgi:hypothetical protein
LPSRRVRRSCAHCCTHKAHSPLRATQAVFGLQLGGAAADVIGDAPDRLRRGRPDARFAVDPATGSGPGGSARRTAEDVRRHRSRTSWSLRQAPVPEFRRPIPHNARRRRFSRSAVSARWWARSCSAAGAHVRATCAGGSRAARGAAYSASINGRAHTTRARRPRPSRSRCGRSRSPVVVAARALHTVNEKKKVDR